MDEVSILSWPGCDPLIRIDVANAALSHVGRVCLLYPAGTRCLKGRSVAIVRSEAGSLAYCCLGPWYRGFAGLVSML